MVQVALTFSRLRISWVVEASRLLWRPSPASEARTGREGTPIPLEPTLDPGRGYTPQTLPGGARVRSCVCEDQPWVQNGCRRKMEKQTGNPAEAVLSPVNTPRGAFIWVVITSAKPTKCLQPASRRCTRCKTRDCVFLSDISPGHHYPCVSLPAFFCSYTHVGINRPTPSIYFLT